MPGQQISMQKWPLYSYSLALRLVYIFISFIKKQKKKKSKNGVTDDFFFFFADGDEDCPDGDTSDEEDCHVNGTKLECKPNYFACADGSLCIPSTWQW